MTSKEFNKHYKIFIRSNDRVSGNINNANIWLQNLSPQLGQYKSFVKISVDFFYMNPANLGPIDGIFIRSSLPQINSFSTQTKNLNDILCFIPNMGVVDPNFNGVIGTVGINNNTTTNYYYQKASDTEGIYSVSPFTNISFRLTDENNNLINGITEWVMLLDFEIFDS